MHVDLRLNVTGLASDSNSVARADIDTPEVKGRGVRRPCCVRRVPLYVSLLLAPAVNQTVRQIIVPSPGETAQSQTVLRRGGIRTARVTLFD
jgi:hypothetical protein